MIIDFEALESLRAQVIDLEKAVADLAGSNKEYFKDIETSILKVAEGLKGSIDVESTKAVSESADRIAAQTAKLTSSLSTTSSIVAKLEGASSGLVNAVSSFESLGKKFNDLYESVKTPKKKKRKRSFKSRHPLIWKEAKGVARVSKGYVTKLKIPTPGNILGGTILGMAFGLGEEQRLEAQAGKAKNVLVAAVDGAMSDATGVATQWLNAFGERMQKFYGISAEEIFKLQNSFTQAGRSTKETVLTHINPALGEVGENAVSYTLALDKLFELSTGTMASSVIKYSEQFGTSIAESNTALTRMLAAGSGEGGVGSLKFLEYINQTSDALANMGYKITDVVDLSYAMSENWKKIGVPRHLAVQAVGAGIKGIAGGMKGMGTDWQTYLAGVAGYGEGLEGRNKFVDSMAKLAKGGKERFQEDIISIARSTLEAVGGDEDRARVLLEKGPGFGIEGARLAMAMLAASASGDLAKMKELDDKVTGFQGQVAKSLETEQSKMTKLQIFYNEWLKGVHDVGMGILGIIGDSLSITVAFFANLPSLLSTAFSKKGAEKDKKLEKITDKILSYQNLNSHVARLKDGSSQMISAGKHMGAEIVGENAAAAVAGVIKLADIIKAPGGAGVPKKQVPRASYAGGGAKPQVEYVYLPAPAQKPLAYAADQYGDDPYGGDSTYAGKMTYGKDNFPTIEGAAAFMGTPLKIVSRGVDVNGDQTMELQGDCPGCGLHFGEEQTGDYNTEEITLATMLESEMGSSYLKNKKGRLEAAGVAFTAINRANKAKDKDLLDVITSGKGFGKQGKKRQYSTAVGSDDPTINKGRKVTPQMLQFSRDILGGKVANPVGTATHFLHYTKGAGYGSKAKALPPFAQEKTNVANIGKARFYAKKGTEASDKEALDKKYISSFEAKHPDVDPLTGDSTAVASAESAPVKSRG